MGIFIYLVISNFVWEEKIDRYGEKYMLKWSFEFRNKKIIFRYDSFLLMYGNIYLSCHLYFCNFIFHFSIYFSPYLFRIADSIRLWFFFQSEVSLIPGQINKENEITYTLSNNFVWEAKIDRYGEKYGLNWKIEMTR